jgi:DNA-binding transcriptional ArsR family regulator
MAALRHHRLNGDVDIARVAALIGDDARAAMLLALGSGVPLSASDLAASARISPQTASEHLAKLVDGGLLRAERRGRFSYFSIAHSGVSRAIEALGQLAPQRAPNALSEATKAQALRNARTCYDHLAGKLGVALFEALVRRRALKHPDGEVVLGPRARALFAGLGVDLDGLHQGRRRFTATCLDWTERQPHLSGVLGAALCAAFFANGWCARAPESRAIVVTREGRQALQERFDI